MAIIKETWELLLPILNTINKTFTVSSVIDNGNGTFKLNTCNTLWLTINYNLTIGAETYKIIDVEPNEWVLLQGVNAPILTSFDVYSPFKFHGTIIAQSEELNATPISFNKFPMIYLHEITRERFNVNEEETIDRESECDLYFMVDCNIQNWLTNDHYKYAIRPMRNLLFETITALKLANNVGIFTDFEVFDQAKWGVYIADKGHKSKIFKDDLSGTQLRITIPFKKELKCNSICN
jgi:hypothetical protein